MNSTETALLEHVSDNPGVHYNELVRSLGVTPDKLQRVGEQLDESGEIVIDNFHGKTHYFPTAYDHKTREAIALLRRETSRDILVYLLHEDRAHPSDIAETIGVARSTLEWHVNRLIDAELIDKEHDGRRVVLVLVDQDRVETGLKTVEPSLSDRLIDRTTRLFDQFFE